MLCCGLILQLFAGLLKCCMQCLQHRAQIAHSSDRQASTAVLGKPKRTYSKDGLVGGFLPLKSLLSLRRVKCRVPHCFYDLQCSPV